MKLFNTSKCVEGLSCCSCCVTGQCNSLRGEKKHSLPSSAYISSQKPTPGHWHITRSENVYHPPSLKALLVLHFWTPGYRGLEQPLGARANAFLSSLKPSRKKKKTPQKTENLIFYMRDNTHCNLEVTRMSIWGLMGPNAGCTSVQIRLC